MRSARTSRIRAFVCDVSVTMPACEPVSEIARWPRSLIAIAHSAHEMRSPVESSMSISRGSGVGETSSAIAISSSVVLPRAESTATTAVALLLARATMRLRGALDALGVGDGGAAELHDHGAVHGRGSVGDAGASGCGARSGSWRASIHGPITSGACCARARCWRRGRRMPRGGSTRSRSRPSRTPRCARSWRSRRRPAARW